jgi:hypothetical protein
LGMEDVALILAGTFLAGALFAFALMRFFLFGDSSLEKENREQEEEAAEKGGNCF